MTLRKSEWQVQADRADLAFGEAVAGADEPWLRRVRAHG